MKELECIRTARAAEITGLSIRTIQYPAHGRTVSGAAELGRGNGKEVANG